MEKYCQNCNCPNPSDAAFCRHCASPLAPGQSGQPPPNVNQNQSGNQSPPPNRMNFGGSQSPQNFGQDANKPGTKAIAALGLAVAGLVLCCGPVTGIPAAIVGWLEMTAIKEGRSSQSGMWMAQVGLWGGIGVSVLSVILWFVFGFLSMLSSPGYY